MNLRTIPYYDNKEQKPHDHSRDTQNTVNKFQNPFMTMNTQMRNRRESPQPAKEHQ